MVAASLEDCLKLLTVIARADRFNEGHLGSMIERGQIAAVLNEDTPYASIIAALASSKLVCCDYAGWLAGTE